MIRVKSVTLERNNEQVVFDYFGPFYLESCSGIYEAAYENSAEDSYLMDGTTVRASKQSARGIEIVARIKERYEERREQLYNLLPAGEYVKLYSKSETGKVKQINCKAENIDFDGKGRVRELRISLICENPFFEDTSPTFYNMAQWVGGGNFPINIKSTGNHMEERQAEQIKAISNPSNVPLPLKITFIASSEVVNPSLKNLTTNEVLQIDITMDIGDVVTIDTSRGVKNKIMYNGVPANNKWHYGSDWMELPIGDNVFRYDAEIGLDYLDVLIEATTRYRGA